MQRTVLELVQDILTECGGDEINSISDTIESGDVATIMRQVYSEMIDEFSLPSVSTLQALVGLGDLDLPNVMQIPDGSYDIKWIKYNNQTDPAANMAYAPVSYMDPEAFVSMVNSNPNTDTDNYQTVMWDSNIPLVINKTKGPSFWTSFDDNYIVFDSFNQTVDSTLQSSKSIFYAETRPTFFIEDEFTPELPENLENVLYIQTLNRYLGTDDKIRPGTQRQESRGRVRTQRNKWKQGRQKYLDPDFGRK